MGKGNWVVRRLALILIVWSLGGCDFEHDIVPVEFPTAPPQPFQAFSSEPGVEGESPEESVRRLLDRMYDPFDVGADFQYEGSVYQRMDQILAGAYAYYGYDSRELAARGQDNH